MHPNPVDCDAATARYRDRLPEAERGRTLLARRAVWPLRGGGRRLGALLVRVGRLEGVEAEPLTATPVGRAGMAPRA